MNTHIQRPEVVDTDSPQNSSVGSWKCSVTYICISTYKGICISVAIYMKNVTGLYTYFTEYMLYLTRDKTRMSVFRERITQSSTTKVPSWGLLFDNSDSVSYPNVHPTNQVFHLNWPKLVSLTTKRLTANEKSNVSQCLLCTPMKSRFQLKFHKSQKILQNSNSKPNMVKFISYVQKKKRERKKTTISLDGIKKCWKEILFY